MNTFIVSESTSDFSEHIYQFIMTPCAPIPVFVGKRGDIENTVKVASSFYRRRREFERGDVGVLLTPNLVENPIWKLLELVCDRWISIDETKGLQDSERLLVVGLYQDLKSSSVLGLLMSSFEDNSISIGFVSGRDIHSLSWLLAKQFAESHFVESGEIGFFSTEEMPDNVAGVHVFDVDQMEEENIRETILSRSWKKIVFQGHGKDDSINLADYTICGRAEVASIGDALPRCGYGGQKCYKDEEKLIPLAKVRADEIVLSACNSAPMSDMGLYDSKYLLLLSAIDGFARTISAGLTVHDSDFPENDLWLREVHTGVSSSHLLNESLRVRHPYPAFWTFGVPKFLNVQKYVDLIPERRYLDIQSRAQSYLVHSFINPKHWLRNRLSSLNQKMNGLLRRKSRHQVKLGELGILKELDSDLQSLDFAIASQVMRNPEDDVMNFEKYYADRSVLWKESACTILCTCGHKAFRYQRKGIISSILDTDAVTCFRCGDKQFLLSRGPRIDTFGLTRVRAGGCLTISVRVIAKEDGPVHVGLFVPLYIRTYISQKPVLKKRKVKAGEETRFEFNLMFSDETPAQAYYFTAFCVQDLAISTSREHFQLVL